MKIFTLISISFTSTCFGHALGCGRTNWAIVLGIVTCLSLLSACITSMFAQK